MSEWSSKQLFKSRGCLLSFPRGVSATRACFIFVEINASTFVFVFSKRFVKFFCFVFFLMFGAHEIEFDSSAPSDSVVL